MSSDITADHLPGSITPRRRRRRKNIYKTGFSHEKALIYGVIQCLAGIAFLVLGVVSVASGAWGYKYGCGLWCGALALLAGVFGLASSRHKTNKLIITFMVFSVMSATGALITVAVASVGIVADHSLFDEMGMQTYSSALIVNSLTIVVSIVTAFSGTMAAIVGCRGVCGAWYGGSETPSRRESDIFTHPPADYPHILGDNFDPAFLSNHTDVGLMSGSRLPDTNNLHLPLLGSGYQQITIVPPQHGNGNNTITEGDDPSGRMVIMQSSGAGNPTVSQVMYILQAGAPCPQPGQPPADNADHSFSSPPPSYSTLALDALSRSGEQHRLDPDSNSGSNSDPDNNVETPHNLSTYSYDVSCPSNITNIILQDLCRLTNNPQRRVNALNTNSAINPNHSINTLQNNTNSEIMRNDESFRLLEGETSFTSDFSGDPGQSSSWSQPLHRSDSINDQELPLLEASPQRYRPRPRNHGDTCNEETIVTHI